MAHYVFTNSMKRHERAQLCIRLCNEMHDNKVLERLLIELWEIIDKKKKNNRFKTIKQPVYAIKTSSYKGTTFYLIVDQHKGYDVIFNTSPMDAAYVEFTKAITEESAIVYTQHALDRYNERIHADKYTSHRDIIKRFIVNNPVKTDIIVHGPDNKTIQRVNEGFLCGHVDASRSCLVMNTFFDNQEYTDTEEKSIARTEFKRYTEWSPERRQLYEQIHINFLNGSIDLNEYQLQMVINGFDKE